MFAEKPRLARAIRYALGTAIGVSTSLSGAAAFAQEPGAKPVEEIYVTGSRIGRTSDFESPSPVASFDRADLDKAGYANLQQLLEKQPFVGNGTFSSRGNNQDSTANGAASVSLRGLGADATLVLVNGRRVAISSFAESITTNFVDINSIPVAAIERLEVLKDGASAVYGSDAVAGVVNVVLRKDFEGAELSTTYGATTESGNDEFRASGIWGINGDDSNITVILDYYKNSTLENIERGSLGSADQSSRGGQDLRSSRSFPGNFTVTDASGTSTRIDPSCPPDRNFDPTCVYDYGPFNLLMPEAERTGLLLLGHAGLGAGLEAFTEIGVQHNNSIARGAPTPLDETALMTVPTTHPDNPFPGATDIVINRYRTVDAGARQWDISTDNLRMVLGLRGSFNDFGWEISGQRARSESEQTGDRSMGWVRTDFLQQQIDLGNYNPFGATQNPQSVIDAITTSLVRQGQSDLTAYDAQISGPLFDMPAGELRVAAGLEYRDESISDVPDDQFQRGLIFGTEAVSAAAQRDNWSAYVEFLVPLFEGLELSLAGRYDDYSDFGDTTNPKVAVRWAPIESLAFRASWGTGFRAPSLAQIGLGPSQDSLFFEDTFGCADNPVYCGTNVDRTVVFSGNPDLQPEESESYNFGIAWQPTDAFRVSVDYWDITQEDKIDRLPFLAVYNANCGDQNSTVCVRGTPLPGDTLGPIQSVSNTFANLGEQSVNGVDLGVYFSSDLGAGALSLGLDYTRLLEFNRFEAGADGVTLVTRDLAGKYEYPEDRFVLNGDWELETWGFNAAVNYIGKFDDLNASLDFDDSTRSVDAFVTLNLQARYTGIEGLTIAVGLDNALDEEPPFAIGDGDTDLYGYVQSQHNPRGRLAYGKLTYRFE
jgi:outer membrane receptor protein involved in Fe transport